MKSFLQTGRSEFPYLIRLFTSLYPEPAAVRQDEISTCLRRNTHNSLIGCVNLLLERDIKPAFHDRKLSFKSVNHRPDYNHFLEWTKELLTSDSDTTIIANSDIYFDKSIAVLAMALQPGQCAALARWDIQEDGSAVLFDRNDSQDVWVFKGPLREVRGDFPVGVPRCDNRFLYELKRAGYEVINPAFSIRAFHLHAGERRDYLSENLDLFVKPPYAYLWPHNLWSLPRTLWHNLRHPQAQIGWRLDRRRIARSLPLRAARKLLGLLRPASESAR